MTPKPCKYCRTMLREIPLSYLASRSAFKKHVPAVVCDYCDKTAKLPSGRKAS